MYRRFLTYSYKICFCGLLTFSATNSIAQSVNETVNFDNYISSTDNDLANKFSSAARLTQITTDGITGGALNTPSYIEWGDDKAIYHSKYKGVTGGAMVTSISFKYNGALANPNADQRTASIWLTPRKNPDHRLVATIERNKTLGLLGYQYTSAYNVSLSMLDDHWYKLQFSSTTTGGPFGDRIDYEVTVFELGLDGMASPVSIGSVTGTIYDIKFTTDNAIDVALTGTKWGGAEFLDNFSFSGPKNTIPQPDIISPIHNSRIWVASGDSVEIITTPAGAVDVDGDSLTKTIQVYQNGVKVFANTFKNDRAVYAGFRAHNPFMISVTMRDGTNLETKDSIFLATDNSFPECELTYPEDGGILTTIDLSSFRFSPILTSSPGGPNLKFDQDNDELSYKFELYDAKDSLLATHEWRSYIWYPYTFEFNGFDRYYLGHYDTWLGTVYLHPPNFHKPLKLKVGMTDQFETCYSISTFIPNILPYYPKILSPAFNQVASYDKGLLPIVTEPYEFVDVEGDSLFKFIHITGPRLDTLIITRSGDPVYLRGSELLPGTEYTIDARLSDGYDTIGYQTSGTFTTPLVTGLEEDRDFRMNISPNPFESEIMIEVPPEFKIERIRIVNILGQIVLDQPFVDSGPLSLVVPSGTYVLEGYDASGGKRLARRIVRR